MAISATIHNIQDIGEWLDVPRHGIFAFGEEVRPVKLTTIVKGFPMTKTDFLFERRLNDHLAGVIQQYSKGRPTLVFCRHVPRHDVIVQTYQQAHGGYVLYIASRRLTLYSVLKGLYRQWYMVYALLLIPQYVKILIQH